MPKTIAQRVFAGGQWWEVGDEPPEAVAATIRNPRVWSTDEDDTDTDTAPAARRDGPRLAGRVAVGGQWYGPDDDVPDDVARRITNPKAWEGGELPTFAAETDRSAAASGTASGDGPTGPDAGDGDATRSTGETQAEPARVPAPQRSGKGSGKDAWEAFLAASGVDYDRNATRDELIATAERAQLIDKE